MPPRHQWRKRLTSPLSIVLLALLIVSAVGSSFLLSHQITRAQSGQTITVQTPLSLSATISYDNNGIPLISASSYTAAAAGWGYVAANERLFQLYDLLWTGSGTLSQYLGAGASDSNISSDQLFATLNLTGLANAAYNQSSNQTRTLLQAYAEGVNCWVATNHLPQDFIDLENAGVTINLPAWTPQDSILIGMESSASLDLQFWTSKITYFAISSASSQLADALIPIMPDAPSMFSSNGVLTAPAAFDSANIYSGTSQGNTASISTVQTLNRIGIPSSQITAAVSELSHLRTITPSLSTFNSGPDSNNYAVSGAYTESGQAIVGNDPHLFAQVPSLLFPTEIKIPSLTVSGISLPGLPGFVSFEATHSSGPTTAAAVTFAMVDDSDVRSETLRSVSIKACPSGEQADIDGSWQCATARSVTIQVAGSQSVPMTILSVIHGGIPCPIINPAFSGALDSLGQFSLQTTMASSSWSLNGFLNLPLQTGSTVAATKTALLSSINNIGVGFNYLYGIGSHIGSAISGLVPLRNSANGRTVVPGSSAAYEWTGFATPGELPTAFDPSSGFLATGNNRTIPSTYTAPNGKQIYISNYFDVAARAQVIYSYLNNLIQSNQNVNVDAIADLQLNVYSQGAAVTVPAILNALSGVTIPTDSEQALVKDVTNWNDQIATNSTPALVYEILTAYLAVDLAAPDTGAIYPLYASDVFISTQLQAVYQQLIDPTLFSPAQQQAWIIQALGQTVQLIASYNLTTWGSVHHVIYQHPLVTPGNIANDPNYAIGPATGFPAAGGTDTVEIGSWLTAVGNLTLSSSDLAAAGGALGVFSQGANEGAQACRVVWDLGNPSASVGVCFTGVSGEPGPFYANLATDWRNGTTIPFWQ